MDCRKSKRKAVFIQSLKITIVIVVGSGIGLAYNSFSDAGIPFRTPIQPDPSELANWHLFLADMRASLEAAKRAFDRKEAVFLDARSPAIYANGHIPGALNIPSYDTGTQIKEHLDHLSKNILIITYCSGGNCQSSIKLATRLIDEYGFKRVLAFYDGWHSWLSAGFPVKTGDTP